MKKVRKVANNILPIIVVIILFCIMIITLYQNIILKQKKNELNSYLKEYYALEEEINSLKSITENYEIIKQNNQDLEKEKNALEEKIEELETQINTLNEKIENLK